MNSAKKSMSDFSKPTLKVHWRLCQGISDNLRTRKSILDDSSISDIAIGEKIKFCQTAENLGFDSVLIDFGHNKPDPILLATAIGLQTERIKFIIACRSGLLSPTLFVQQLNTLSQLIPNRFSLNIVAGHTPAEQKAYGDMLSHDERYARTGEYLEISKMLCTSQHSVDYSGKYYRISEKDLNVSSGSAKCIRSEFWPELFIAGSSSQAQSLAKKNSAIWMSLVQPVVSMAGDIKQMIAAGNEVGVRLSVICRETRQKAITAAQQLVADRQSNPDKLADIENIFVKKSDSEGIKKAYKLAAESTGHWHDRCLWTGAVKTHGAPSIALVGSAEDIALSIFEYYKMGVSHFIFSGWPQLEEMKIFGRDVLPLLYKFEKQFYTL